LHYFNDIFQPGFLVALQQLPYFVFFSTPYPAFRYSPYGKSFFSMAPAIASFGRFAALRKNSFYHFGAAAPIRGELLNVKLLFFTYKNFLNEIIFSSFGTTCFHTAFLR